MNKKFLTCFIFLLIYITGNAQTLVYHDIQKDNSGKLLSWYSPNHGASYDYILNLVWNFWKNIDTCCGGHKFYMVDHSYNNPVSGNKIGGDQFAMALSSWALYYAYTGDTDLINDMVYIADTYLANSLSDSSDAWPNIPYPCNYTNPLSTVYDGDFIHGAGVTQPDKAASFAAELITLYKITNNYSYLQAAMSIANTLASKVTPGDADIPPYPFRIVTQDGSFPTLLPIESHYIANMEPYLRLFEELSKMNVGNTVQYDTAYVMIKRWVKQYPIQTNYWGGFFENIYSVSNTEINGVSMAMYILEHPDWSSTWLQDARGILDWVLNDLGSHAYDSLGVTAIYEQSVDLKEGGSHTARFASIELLYAELTGDTSRVDQAIRQLNWSTYLCDFDGRVKFSPQSGSAWYTDGYGDYVRHFLRAMAYNLRLAPDSSNHLLRSSSVVTWIKYQPKEIHYITYDNSSEETLRLTSKPSQVKADGQVLSELSSLTAEGYVWTPLPVGGVLTVRHDNGGSVEILWNNVGIENHVENANQTIKAYPNPATGLVVLEFNNQKNEPLEVVVYGATGERLTGLKKYFSTNSVNIDLSRQPPGLYLVQLRMGDQILMRKIEKGF